MSLGTFAMYVLIDEENVLTAEKAFVSISLFGTLHWNMIILPHIVNHYVQVRYYFCVIKQNITSTSYGEDRKTKQGAEETPR